MAGGVPAAGFIDQNAAHGLGSRGKEMGESIPLLAQVANEANPCLVHQCCRLQGMARGLICHLGGRQLAQLAVNEREQVLGGLLVALVESVEDLGDVGDEQTIAPVPESPHWVGRQ